MSKPIFGREGAGVYIGANFTSKDQFVQYSERAFGSQSLGKSIYQKYDKMAVV